MATVSWGRRTRYRFAACGQLKRLVAPQVPCVYAITYKQSPEDRPKSHTVIMFGEAENIGHQLSPLAEKLERWWQDHGGSDEPDMYVFLHPMPGSSKFERDQVREQLIAEYDPRGNESLV